MNKEDMQQIGGLLGRFAEDIKKEFSHQLGVQREDFQKQLALIGEGHQMLSEKIDHVETRLNKRMDCLEHKLDAVAAQGDATAAKLETVSIKLDAIAADLKAHRSDTEAHPPLYKVNEDNRSGKC